MKGEIILEKIQDIDVWLNTFIPKPNEIVTLTVDFDTITLADAQIILKKVYSTFKNSTVLALPSKCSMESMTKESLQLWIDNAKKISDKMN